MMSYNEQTSRGAFHAPRGTEESDYLGKKHHIYETAMEHSIDE